MPPGPQWKAQVSSRASLDGRRLPIQLALPPGRLLGKWLKGRGASWAFSASASPKPGLLGERCAGGFGCCIRRRPTELEKTAYPGDAPGRVRKPTRLREASPWGIFETSALLAGFLCDPVTGEPGRVPPGENHFPTRTLLHRLLNSTTKGSWT